MKIIKFTKMAGAGNDFIIIDALKGIDYKKLAIKACDRSNGIGADGLLIFDKSKKADYKMRIINSDGSEAEMCGNGARCMAAYIAKNKNNKNKLFIIETLAGNILSEAEGETATVKLSEPSQYNPSIKIKVNKILINVSFINTGVPHTVVFVNDLKNINVNKIGNFIRYHDFFKPKGTNVNFVEQVNNSLINARTYERGVESETKACGTGSVACAVVTYLKMNENVFNKKRAMMRVRTTSGEILKVTFDIESGKPVNVYLNGSAKFIAEGEYFF